MKILFLPNNISSISTSSVQALNRIHGCEAKGFYTNKFSHQHSGGAGNYYFVGISRRKNPIGWIMQEIKRFILFKRLLKWADIIHWVYDDKGLKKREIRMIKRSKKPSVIEWVGSDIRNPEILFPINSYYKKVFHSGYEYANYESFAQSAANQSKFKEYGAYPLVNPEMDLFVDKTIFSKRYFVWPRMVLEDYECQYPLAENKKPLILHSPTAKFAKGSEYIISAIEKLQNEYEFEFKLISNTPRPEVMQLMRQCDIFIDQVILGMYGLASCEAMCFGKPVLCYLMPTVLENGLPSDCPIVNTKIEDIEANIRMLLENGELRSSIGRKSRKYAEEYFNAKKKAEVYVGKYEEVLINLKEGE